MKSKKNAKIKDIETFFTAMCKSIFNGYFNFKDFHDHQPPTPVRFRNVIFKNLTVTNSENNYLICGQFLAQENQNEADWISFAAIKTSGYENWEGLQLLGFCKDSKAISYKMGDLPAALKVGLTPCHKLQSKA